MLTLLPKLPLKVTIITSFLGLTAITTIFCTLTPPFRPPPAPLRSPYAPPPLPSSLAIISQDQ